VPLYDVTVQSVLVRRTGTHTVLADTEAQAVQAAMSDEAEWLRCAHPTDPPEARQVLPLGCTVRGPRGLVGGDADATA